MSTLRQTPTFKLAAVSHQVKVTNLAGGPQIARVIKLHPASVLARTVWAANKCMISQVQFFGQCA